MNITLIELNYCPNFVWIMLCLTLCIKKTTYSCLVALNQNNCRTNYYRTHHLLWHLTLILNENLTLVICRAYVSQPFSLCETLLLNIFCRTPFHNQFICGTKANYCTSFNDCTFARSNVQIVSQNKFIAKIVWYSKIKLKYKKLQFRNSCFNLNFKLCRALSGFPRNSGVVPPKQVFLVS